MPYESPNIIIVPTKSFVPKNSNIITIHEKTAHSGDKAAPISGIPSHSNVIKPNSMERNNIIVVPVKDEKKIYKIPIRPDTPSNSNVIKPNSMGRENRINVPVKDAKKSDKITPSSNIPINSNAVKANPMVRNNIIVVPVKDEKKVDKITPRSDIPSNSNVVKPNTSVQIYEKNNIKNIDNITPKSDIPSKFNVLKPNSMVTENRIFVPEKDAKKGDKIRPRSYIPTNWNVLKPNSLVQENGKVVTEENSKKNVKITPRSDIPSDLVMTKTCSTMQGHSSKTMATEVNQGASLTLTSKSTVKCTKKAKENETSKITSKPPKVPQIVPKTVNKNVLFSGGHIVHSVQLGDMVNKPSASSGCLQSNGQNATPKNFYLENKTQKIEKAASALTNRRSDPRLERGVYKKITSSLLETPASNLIISSKSVMDTKTIQSKSAKSNNITNESQNINNNLPVNSQPESKSDETNTTPRSNKSVSVTPGMGKSSKHFKASYKMSTDYSDRNITSNETTLNTKPDGVSSHSCVPPTNIFTQNFTSSTSIIHPPNPWPPQPATYQNTFFYDCNNMTYYMQNYLTNGITMFTPTFATNINTPCMIAEMEQNQTSHMMDNNLHRLYFNNTIPFTYNNPTTADFLPGMDTVTWFTQLSNPGSGNPRDVNCNGIAKPNVINEKNNNDTTTKSSKLPNVDPTRIKESAADVDKSKCDSKSLASKKLTIPKLRSKLDGNKESNNSDKLAKQCRQEHIKEITIRNISAKNKINNISDKHAKPCHKKHVKKSSNEASSIKMSNTKELINIKKIGSGKSKSELSDKKRLREGLKIKKALSQIEYKIKKLIPDNDYTKCSSSSTSEKKTNSDKTSNGDEHKQIAKPDLTLEKNCSSKTKNVHDEDIKSKHDKNIKSVIKAINHSTEQTRRKRNHCDTNNKLIKHDIDHAELFENKRICEKSAPKPIEPKILSKNIKYESNQRKRDRLTCSKSHEYPPKKRIRYNLGNEVRNLSPIKTDSQHSEKFEEKHPRIQAPENDIIKNDQETDFDLRSKLSRINSNNFPKKNLSPYDTLEKEFKQKSFENLQISVTNENNDKEISDSVPLRSNHKQRNKKYKKIKLVIKVMCPNQEESSDESSSDKSNSDNYVTGEPRNSDLSFLDDFDIDEIVNSLKHSPKQESSQQNRKSVLKNANKISLNKFVQPILIKSEIKTEDLEPNETPELKKYNSKCRVSEETFKLNTNIIRAVPTSITETKYDENMETNFHMATDINEDDKTLIKSIKQEYDSDTEYNVEESEISHDNFQTTRADSNYNKTDSELLITKENIELNTDAPYTDEKAVNCAKLNCNKNYIKNQNGSNTILVDLPYSKTNSLENHHEHIFISYTEENKIHKEKTTINENTIPIKDNITETELIEFNIKQDPIENNNVTNMSKNTEVTVQHNTSNDITKKSVPTAENTFDLNMSTGKLAEKSSVTSVETIAAAIADKSLMKVSENATSHMKTSTETTTGIIVYKSLVDKDNITATGMIKFNIKQEPIEDNNITNISKNTEVIVKHNKTIDTTKTSVQTAENTFDLHMPKGKLAEKSSETSVETIEAAIADKSLMKVSENATSQIKTSTETTTGVIVSKGLVKIAEKIHMTKTSDNKIATVAVDDKTSAKIDVTKTSTKTAPYDNSVVKILENSSNTKTSIKIVTDAANDKSSLEIAEKTTKIISKTCVKLEKKGDDKKTKQPLNNKIETVQQPWLTKHLKDLAKKVEDSLCNILGRDLNVISLIRKGKFSNVFKCQDKTGRNYAVKVTTNEFTFFSSGVKLKKMMNDIQRDIPKQNLNTIYFINGFTFDKKWCFLLEYYPENLEDALKKKIFHIDEVQILGRQLASAVMMLRSNNVIHSDIKPSHILLDTSNTKLKLCGFDASYYGNCIKLLPNIGTAGYRAPEVILGYSAGFTIDVWSSALVMFEMTTGQPLFQKGRNNALLFNQMSLMGNIPMPMLGKSRFARNHFLRGTFMKKTGPNINDFTLIPNFYPTFSVYSLRESYIRTWGSTTTDLQKVNSFCNMLEQMLVLDPAQRITIEFVDPGVVKIIS